jgi:FkbM family methyltransferase
MTRPKAILNYVQALGFFDGLRVFAQALRTRPRRGESSESFSLRVYGTRIHLRATRSDHATFFQCLVRRQYDVSAFPQYKALWNFYKRQLQLGATPLIIDCGGNIGLSAVWYATNFPKATIVVVEPDSENLKILRLNVAPFESRVLVVEGGVWSHPTRLRIINPTSGSAAFRVEECSSIDDTGVRAYSVEELCKIGGNDRPIIVKLDVEGSQKQIFARNTSWIDRTGMIGLELDDWLLPWSGTSRPFFQALSVREFDFLLGGESIFCFNAQILRDWSVGLETQAKPPKF